MAIFLPLTTSPVFGTIDAYQDYDLILGAHMWHFQHTIKKEVSAAGVGLHTGELVRVRLRPAEPNQGIVFVRTDLVPPRVIPARADYVIHTELSTVIGVGEASVGTIEHLMAALAGLGVDNVIVEIDGPEIPAMDGSALAFVHLLRQAGLRRQRVRRHFIKVLRPFVLEEAGRKIAFLPASDLELEVLIDFKHEAIGQQRYVRRLSRQRFMEELAPARTFGFLHEIEYLRRNGYARGGSLDNAIVLTKRGILNHEGLRFDDEFVRHKALDLLGDLYLLGFPLMGRVVAERTGHGLHHQAIKVFLAQEDAWKLIPYPSESFSRPGLMAMALAQA
ncbi:UDP-3-O-acyl-N-acetylglucosamine deacetylase [Thermosulfuriphilus sp.]